MKLCKYCNEEKDESLFGFQYRKEGTIRNLRPMCKACDQKRKREQDAAKREKRLAFERHLQEVQRKEFEKVKHLIAKPRTFTFQDWDGKIDQGYVRNEGLKHIPSKGFQ